MIYVALSVVCSVMLGFLFKLFPRYGVDSFQAIVVNYFTCVACGWLLMGKFPIATQGIDAPWVPYALILGVIFISGFNFAAQTVRYFGVTIGQIMQKMSILMTVPFAILAYHESSGIGKIIGFLAALGSIILVNLPARTVSDATPKEAPRGTRLLWLPVATWLLSGILEVLFVKVQKENIIDPNDPSFITTIFGTAGVLGLIITIIGLIQGKLRFSWRNVAGGIILGIPNYGSMLFMLRALGSGLEGSFVFPATNVSIILVTTIGAVALFQERLSKINWLGIGLAVAAIALISG
jgi:drug/metabolite transporter (DMT)-like permease